MNLIGPALAGIYVVVTTRSASATSGKPADSAETGEVDVICESGEPTNTTVSRPVTTVRVTCPDTSSPGKVFETAGDYIYSGATCSQRGVLSNVCPGATMETAQQAGKNESKEDVEASTAKTIVTSQFPQLPASQQVPCVRCPAKSKSGSDKDCKALITVAAASPQGPQACAVGGTSVTLEINKAGDSAQFKRGKNPTLAPTEPTKAYADDCRRVETLKDMTRSDGPKDSYVAVTVAKLRKNELCYLCQPSALAP